MFKPTKKIIKKNVVRVGPTLTKKSLSELDPPSDKKVVVRVLPTLTKKTLSEFHPL